MGTQYSHLSDEQRAFIEAGLRQGLSQATIADLLGIHRSSVWREVQRASRSGKPTYRAATGAQAYTEGRRRNGLARRKT